MGNVNPREATAVVLPDKPLFDKILALYILCALTDRKVNWERGRGALGVYFWGGSKLSGMNAPTDVEVEMFDGMGWYAIDLGAKKYTQAGFGSSTEMVLRDLGAIEEAGVARVFDLTRQWFNKSRLDEAKRLAQRGVVVVDGHEVKAAHLLRDNCKVGRLYPYLDAALRANRNNATGFLKGMRSSFVLLLRRQYEMGIDPVVVVEMVWDMLVAHFKARTGGAKKGRGVESLLEHPKLKDFFIGIGAGNRFQSFTLAGYLLDLWMTGATVKEIELEADAAFTAWEGVMEQAKWAKDVVLPTEDLDMFAGDQIVVIRSDNTAAVRAVWKVYPATKIVVARKSSGHVAILANGLDTKDLATALQAAEPGLWYFMPITGAVINGGICYSKVTPSNLGDRELVALVNDLVLRLGIRMDKAPRRDWANGR